MKNYWQRHAYDMVQMHRVKSTTYLPQAQQTEEQVRSMRQCIFALLPSPILQSQRQQQQHQSTTTIIITTITTQHLFGDGGSMDPINKSSSKQSMKFYFCIRWSILVVVWGIWPFPRHSYCRPQWCGFHIMYGVVDMSARSLAGVVGCMTRPNGVVVIAVITLPRQQMYSL